MGILASRYSRTSALICVGLSQSSAPCRAFACGVVNRPAATRLVPRGLSSYGINRYIDSKFFYQNRTWRQRYVLPVQHSTVSCDESAIASKWKFISDDDNTSASPRQRDSLIKNILVCGDGDLSYCAEIAPELERLGIELFATVLEEEDIHNRVYHYSRSNADIIASSGQTVMFGVDATTLSTYFGNETINTRFDRIQFNFPHWKGKANNRYNRQLLNDFLQSASTVLSPGGEIHVALCDGQGGCSATSLLEWRGSWTASLFAGEHGLLLARVSPYEAQYRLSSHRGVDRPFNLGNNPQMHVFVKPDGIISAPRDIQLCCRHELHINITNENEAAIDQMVVGDAIKDIIQSNCVPAGIRVEVPARQILEINEAHGSSRVAVFLVAYCSEGYHLTRTMADQWRELAESEVSKYVPLRENRRGRTVSHPFPYPALHPEIKYHTTGEKTNS
ncbi:hypothetical protein ACHAWU_008861 [Discostella pseudostelligera]|uniref:25S rRNA (uridine-N(3))-methyltransferase BMT5-like domain-containing protein n=1 Tax=Discostella pseudostelligera TaxID=259834 RepID=A0ABD3N0G5_9STRA